MTGLRRRRDGCGLELASTGIVVIALPRGFHRQVVDEEQQHLVPDVDVRKSSLVFGATAP
jgi:hypothetical protein